MAALDVGLLREPPGGGVLEVGPGRERLRRPGQHDVVGLEVVVECARGLRQLADELLVERVAILLAVEADDRGRAFSRALSSDARGATEWTWQGL